MTSRNQGFDFPRREAGGLMVAGVASLLLLATLSAVFATGLFQSSSAQQDSACEAEAEAIASKEPQPRKTRFILEEYEPFGELGIGAIEGQAFLWGGDGDLVYGAGKLIFMNPVTTYSTEWWERNVMCRVELEPTKDQRGRYYHWITIADGFGQFRFENLPAGEYYLGSRVIEGEQFAYARVTLAEGETAKILLTHGVASGRAGKSRGPHNNPIRLKNGDVP